MMLCDEPSRRLYQAQRVKLLEPIQDLPVRRIGGDFFCPARQKTAGILAVLQGFLTQRDEKIPVKAACREILNRLLAFDDGGARRPVEKIL